MKISELRFEKIRSFVEPATLRFSQNINIITGLNGAGKSTTLEAIRYALSGHLSQYYVTRNAFSPFIVSSELVFSNGKSVKQSAQAQLNKVAVTLKNQTKVGDMQLSSGIIDFLLLCSVDDMYWMFRRPSEIFNTANEILSFEKLAKFSSEMLTQSNRRIKCEDNLGEVLERYKQLRDLANTLELAKKGSKLCASVIPVFRKAYNEYEQIQQIGEVVVSEAEEVFDETAYESHVELRDYLMKSLKMKELEIAKLQVYGGLNPGVAYSEETLQQNLAKIEAAYHDIRPINQQLDALMLQYRQTKDIVHRYLLSEHIYELYKQTVQQQEQSQELSVYKLKYLDDAYKAAQKYLGLLQEQLSALGYAESLEQELAALRQQFDDENAKLLALEKQSEGLRAERKRLAAETQILRYADGAALEFIKSQNAVTEFIAQQWDSVQRDWQKLREVVQIEGLLPDYLLAQAERQLSRDFAYLREFGFESCQSYFESVKRLLQVYLADLGYVIAKSSDLLLSRNMAEQFGLLSRQLLGFAQQKGMTEEFVLQLSALFSEYFSELAALQKDTKLTEEIRRAADFAKVLQGVSGLLDLSSGERFCDIYGRYDGAVRRCREFKLAVLSLANYGANDVPAALIRAAALRPELEGFVSSMRARLAQLKHFAATGDAAALLTFNCPQSLGAEQQISLLEAQTAALDQQIESCTADVAKVRENSTALRTALESAQGDARARLSAYNAKKLPSREQLHEKTLLAEKSMQQLAAQREMNAEAAAASARLLEALRASEIEQYAQISHIIAESDRLEKQHAFDLCSARVAELSSQAKTATLELRQAEALLAREEQCRARVQEREKALGDRQKVAALACAMQAAFAEIHGGLSSIFELHKQAERQLGLKMPKTLLNAFSAQFYFTMPYAQHKQLFRALNDYLVQVSYGFSQLIAQKEQTKQLQADLRKSVKIYAENAISARLAREFKTASESLKNAIKDFQDVCFQRANAYFSSFWRDIYMRKDIEDVRIFREKNKATLELQGLVRHEWRPLQNNISAGQRALCSIIFRMALIHSLKLPLALFCSDEPTNFLDEGNEEELARALARFGAQSQLQFIIVTHSERFAEKIIAESGGDAREVRIVNGDGGSHTEVERI